MRAAVIVGVVMMSGPAFGDEPRPGEWRLVATTPAEKVAPRSFAKLIAVPDLDRAIIWGAPSEKGEKDWCTVAFDLAKNAWHPLVPPGQAGWLTERPKMRFRMRWGENIRLERPNDVLQPVPMCYFNQAAYVPSLKKVLFFVGGKHFTLDPVTGTWEELKPATGPPHVVWSAMCYDPVNDEVVLFGGGAACDDDRPGTWLFSAKDGTWRKLDQPLARQPPPRCNSPLAYDSKNRLIALFGGDAQDRFLSDTWVYDCATRRWRELRTDVRPYPRSAPALCFLEKAGVFLMGGAPADRGSATARRDTWILDAAAAKWTCVSGRFPFAAWTSAVYDTKRDRALVYQAGKKAAVWAYQPDLASRRDGAVAPQAPITRYHGPAWYTEGVEPADPSKVQGFLKALRPNEWTPVETPRAAAMRTWGSATVDTDRQEVLYWGGGHCGYCGTDVGHFSLKALRWSTGFLPEFPALPYNAFYGDESSFVLPCRSFTGRPFVQHGRTSYAFDPVSKMVVFTQSISVGQGRGWSYIYDPAKRDFVDHFPQPFVGGYSVSGAVTGTPHGVYAYLTPGDHRSPEVGLFKLDLPSRKWVNLTGGKAAVPCRERFKMVYDSKRDRLVIVSSKPGSRSDEPAMYAWDLAANAAEWTTVAMTGDVPANFYRESVYIAKHDRILNLNQNGLFACDPSAGHTWSKIPSAMPEGATVNPNTTMVYEPGADVLVLISGRNMGPAPVWVMRYAP